MQPSSRDAVQRVLTMAGVTGAALTLSAAAALPAFAGNGHGDEGAQSSHGQAGTSQGKGDNGAKDQGAKDQGAKGQDSKGQGATKDGDGHNPPGNNGTVKIHQVAGDSSPHNVPHVSCDFYVSFFGFDKDQTLNVSFTGQAPTGKDTPIAIKDSSLTSKTSTTDAGGAGHDYDGDLGKYDATNLDLSALGAPAKQGYHIKLDVATGEPGGHKYKVFWFSPCGTTPATGGTQQPGNTQQPPAETEQPGDTEQPGTPGTTAPQMGETQTPGTEAATTGTTAAGAQVLGEKLTRGTVAAAAGATTAPGAQVLGESFSRATPGVGSLPFTGAETGALAAVGLTALGGGTALTVAGRRRRRATARA